MKTYLNWPTEAARISDKHVAWNHPGSNICLDFHGDPIKSKLVIFSDGNHHMALLESIQEFLAHNPDLVDIFYATTPPNVFISGIEQNGLMLGNLLISRRPDIFIGPDKIMENLLNKQFITSHRPFAQSRGNVLLVKRGNPKNITTVEDILRDDVILFISNPQTEKTSYEVYRDTLISMCEEKGADFTLCKRKLSGGSNSVVFGEKIHHREAPQSIYSNTADAAIVYYHLALRYCRIFPDEFDFIPLGGSKENPQPGKANVRTEYHVGLTNNSDNKPSGQKFIEFLLSDEGGAIYASHGLQRHP